MTADEAITINPIEALIDLFITLLLGGDGNEDLPVSRSRCKKKTTKQGIRNRAKDAIADSPKFSRSEYPTEARE
jgi:hypothetical protein